MQFGGHFLGVKRRFMFRGSMAAQWIRLRSSGRVRLITAGNHPKANGDAIPRVHRRNREGQVHDICFGEISAEFLVDGVGCVADLDVCESLGPGQSGPFRLSEERRLTPRIQSVDALLVLSL